MTYDEDDLERQLVSLAHDDSAPSERLRARILDASLGVLEAPAFQRAIHSDLSDSSRPIARLVPDVAYDTVDGAGVGLI